MKTETRKTTGFTLVEFVMATAVTVVIGASVVGVGTGLSRAYEHNQQYNDSLQTARVSTNYVLAALRKAKLVTVAEDDALVLWNGDANADGQINLSEITVLEYHPDDRVVTEKKIVVTDDVSDSWRWATSYEVDLSSLMSDQNTVGRALDRTFHATTRELATGVTDFHVTAWPDPPMTRMVRIRMTVGSGDEAITLRNAVTLRADATRHVSADDNSYNLTDAIDQR